MTAEKLMVDQALHFSKANTQSRVSGICYPVLETICQSASPFTVANSRQHMGELTLLSYEQQIKSPILN